MTLLNKWGMSNCNPCQLPLKPGQDLAQLPLDATPDRKVIAQYSMLVGELMFLSTNTVPTISHVLHALARYMTNATRAHLEIAKQVLRFLSLQALPVALELRSRLCPASHVGYPLLPS